MTSARRGGVSPARRPAGWVAPGPPPRGFDGSPELELRPGESLNLLSGDWRLYQPATGHRWSVDDLLTAHLAAAHAPLEGRALDLGCGLGSVLLMVAWRCPQLALVGLEAQPERAAMARRSTRWNGVEHRVRVVEGDLREASALPEGRFDLVTGTPPYFPSGEGVEPTQRSAAACRFEHRGGVEAYLRAMALALAPSGVGVLCAAALEVDRVMAGATAAGLFVHERVWLEPKPGKPPLVVVVRVGRAAAEAVERTVRGREADGAWSEPMREVRRAMGLPDAPP